MRQRRHLRFATGGIAAFAALALAGPAYADGLGSGLAPVAPAVQSVATTATAATTSAGATAQTATGAAAAVPPAAANTAANVVKTVAAPVKAAAPAPVAPVVQAVEKTATKAADTVATTTKAVEKTAAPVVQAATQTLAAAPQAAAPVVAAVNQTAAPVVAAVDQNAAPVAAAVNQTAAPIVAAATQNAAPAIASTKAAPPAITTQPGAPAKISPAVRSRAPETAKGIATVLVPDASTLTLEMPVAIGPTGNSLPLATAAPLPAPDARQALDSMARLTPPAAFAPATTTGDVTSAPPAPVTFVVTTQATPAHAVAKAPPASSAPAPAPPGDQRLPAFGAVASSSAVSGALFFAILLGSFLLVAPRLGRRLRPVGDLLRPPAFILLLERPG